MVTTLAADQPGAGALTAHLVVGQRHLQRGLHAFRPGVGEKHLAHAGRCNLRQPFSKLEGLRVRHLEGRAEVHLGRLLLDRLHDARPGVASVHTPQASRSVQHLAAAVVPVVHALGTGQKARRLLELAVGGERHPVGGHGGGRNCASLGADALGGVHQCGVDGFVHGSSRWAGKGREEGREGNADWLA